MRHKSRSDHYFNGQEMLKSQFNILIELKADEALFVDISLSLEQVLANTLSLLNKDTK